MLNSKPDEHMGENVPVVTTSDFTGGFFRAHAPDGLGHFLSVEDNGRPFLIRSLISAIVLITL